MISVAEELTGHICSISGNEITITSSPGNYQVYTFNSNGFVTKISSYEDFYFLFTYSLRTQPVANSIASGHYYLIFSAIAIGIIAILVKKRVNFKRKI